MFSRILAWAALCFAISVLGAELLVFLETGAYAPLTMGQIWQHIDMASYVQAEDLIRVRIWPPLWDPILTRLLGIPAWLLLAGISVVFFLIALRRKAR